jgi:hypothetical protein
MNTPKTEASPCGQMVTVTAPGVYRLSELQSEAALAFAELHERPVAWPTLVGHRQTDSDQYVATFALDGSGRQIVDRSARQTVTV